MEIREINEDEFTEGVKKFQYSSIYQSVEYAAVMKHQNYNYLFLGAFKDNTLVATSLLLIEKVKGFNYAYAPRGFLIDYNNTNLVQEFTKELKKFLARLDIVAVKISPLIIRNILNAKGNIIGKNPNYDLAFNNLKTAGYYHYGYNKLFEAYKPRYEAILDISKDYRILFKNIKKEYKTKIRSAERHGIKIYRANSNEINILYEQVKDKYPRDSKYFEDSYKYFNSKDKMDFYYAKLDTQKYLIMIQDEYKKQEQLVAELNERILSEKENSDRLLSRKIEADKELTVYKNKLISATNILKEYPNGFVTASALVAKNKDEIYLYMDGFNPKFKTFSSKHLIMWKIMEKYSQQGYKRFNFGGVTDPTIESKYKGLVLFKTNFGCSIVEYIGDLELVINSFKYSLYRSAKKSVK